MQDNHTYQENGYDPPSVIAMNQSTQNSCQASQIGCHCHCNEAIKESDVSSACPENMGCRTRNALSQKIAVMIMVLHTSLANIAMKVFNATGRSYCCWCCCAIFSVDCISGTMFHSSPHKTPGAVRIFGSLFVLRRNVEYGWSVFIVTSCFQPCLYFVRDRIARFCRSGYEPRIDQHFNRYQTKQGYSSLAVDQEQKDVPWDTVLIKSYPR